MCIAKITSTISEVLSQRLNFFSQDYCCECWSTRLNFTINNAPTWRFLISTLLLRIAFNVYSFKSFTFLCCNCVIDYSCLGSFANDFTKLGNFLNVIENFEEMRQLEIQRMLWSLDCNQLQCHQISYMTFSSLHYSLFYCMIIIIGEICHCVSISSSNLKHCRIMKKIVFLSCVELRVQCT